MIKAAASASGRATMARNVSGGMASLILIDIVLSSLEVMNGSLRENLEFYCFPSLVVKSGRSEVLFQVTNVDC